MRPLVALLILLCTPSLWSQETPRNIFAREFVQSHGIPRECWSELNSIGERLHHYGSLLAFGFANPAAIDPKRAATARELSLSLRQSLGDIEKSKPSCFQSAAAFYAIGSFFEFTFANADAVPFVWLLDGLYDKGKIVALTMKGKRDLERSVQNPAVEKAPSIYGAYNCETSTLFFDPTRAPNDLAAALLHELSHFIHDKFEDPKSLSLDLRTSLILDEGLAALKAGTLQIKVGPRAPWDFDRNLYDVQGPLNRILRLWFPDRGSNEFPEMDTADLLRFASTSDAAAKDMDEIFQRVERGYFPGPHGQVNHIDWQRLVSEHQTFAPSNDFFACGTEECARSVLDRDGATLFRPTPQCLRFMREVRTGRLSDYIGSRILLEPANEGVKPGNEGVKPGNEGVKPGNEGVKPSMPGVLPCLSLGTGF